MTKIIENLARIEPKIAAVNPQQPVTIIAVTKAVSVERTQEAIAAGVTHLGRIAQKAYYVSKRQLMKRLGTISAHYKREKFVKLLIR